MSWGAWFRVEHFLFDVFLKGGLPAQFIGRRIPRHGEKPCDRATQSRVVEVTFQVKFQKYIVDDILCLGEIRQLLRQHRVNQRGVAIV